MIESKSDLLYYLQQDKIALFNENKKKPDLFKDEIWKFEILLRKNEYCTNCLRKLWHMPYKYWIKWRFHKLSIKLGFSIPINVIGPGLSIAHYGTIVIGYAKIGKNLRIQEDVNIGSTNGELNAATIGDNVFIGTGAKVIGDITIADGVAIGANSVVCRSIKESGITVAGVPAKKISNNGSKGFINSNLFLDGEERL